jgi:hypothetical protein
MSFFLLPPPSTEWQALGVKLAAIALFHMGEHASMHYRLL